MEKSVSTDRVKDLLTKINLIKSCIKDYTNGPINTLLDEPITFNVENNIKVQIRLFK